LVVVPDSAAELCLALADALLNKGEPADNFGIVGIPLFGTLQAPQCIPIAV
jgi:hypothetical protein